jgi:hypothetical protein
VRIATWNLEGRWDLRHVAILEGMDCDVLLLTEVRDETEIPGMSLHKTKLEMVPRRRWAAVASRSELTALPDPHGAAAMAEVNGLRFCSSDLPWRGFAGWWPDVGGSQAEMTIAAVADIEAAAPQIWGGDWNHTLTGPDWTGTNEGRSSILGAVDRLDLTVLTSGSPLRDSGGLSVDHIATPASWSAVSVEHRVASVDGKRISDHDAYVVEVGRNRPR